jgi:hypothetical protein
MAILILCITLIDPIDLDTLANTGIDLAFDFPQRQKKEDADPCTLFFTQFEKNFPVWLTLSHFKPMKQILLDQSSSETE